MQIERRVPLGIRFLAAFFAFGVCMCALTIILLLFPGSALDRLWKLNPEAHSSFQSMGQVSVLLMGAVGSACAAAAVGLLRGAAWGKRLAMVILAANLIGGVANAVLRHDLRSLIGLPIGGGMIIYLWSRSGIRGEPEAVASRQRD
jgi:hypothetical protein